MSLKMIDNSSRVCWNVPHFNKHVKTTRRWFDCTIIIIWVFLHPNLDYECLNIKWIIKSTLLGFFLPYLSLFRAVGLGFGMVNIPVCHFSGYLFPSIIKIMRPIHEYIIDHKKKPSRDYFKPYLSIFRAVV